MNRQIPHDPYIQTLGVDISSSPPKTCAILASVLPNGMLQVHNEIVVDRELSRDEVEQLSKYIAQQFMIPDLKVSIDVADYDNWEDGI